MKRICAPVSVIHRNVTCIYMLPCSCWTFLLTMLVGGTYEAPNFVGYVNINCHILERKWNYKWKQRDKQSNQKTRKKRQKETCWFKTSVCVSSEIISHLVVFFHATVCLYLHLQPRKRQENREHQDKEVTQHLNFLLSFVQQLSNFLYSKLDSVNARILPKHG